MRLYSGEDGGWMELQVCPLTGALTGRVYETTHAVDDHKTLAVLSGWFAARSLQTKQAIRLKPADA